MFPCKMISSKFRRQVIAFAEIPHWIKPQGEEMWLDKKACAALLPEQTAPAMTQSLRHVAIKKMLIPDLCAVSFPSDSSFRSSLHRFPASKPQPFSLPWKCINHFFQNI